MLLKEKMVRCLQLQTKRDCIGLGNESGEMLEIYRSDKTDKKYHFWNRDLLAIPLTSEKFFHEKLIYIHFNSLDEKWNLADCPENCRWSSALFYETGIDEFEIISDYRL